MDPLPFFPSPASVAANDQFAAAAQTYAVLTWQITEAFIRAGYTRDEAFDLTLFHLERMAHDGCVD